MSDLQAAELRHVRVSGTPQTGTCPGPSVHGTLQAGILEWVASSSSRGSNSGIKPASPEAPALAGGFFTAAPPGKPQNTGAFTLK